MSIQGPKQIQGPEGLMIIVDQTFCLPFLWCTLGLTAIPPVMIVPQTF